MRQQQIEEWSETLCVCNSWLWVYHIELKSKYTLHIFITSIYYFIVSMISTSSLRLKKTNKLFYANALSTPNKANVFEYVVKWKTVILN